MIWRVNNNQTTLSWSPACTSNEYWGLSPGRKKERNRVSWTPLLHYRDMKEGLCLRSGGRRAQATLVLNVWRMLYLYTMVHGTLNFQREIRKWTWDPPLSSPLHNNWIRDWNSHKRLKRWQKSTWIGQSWHKSVVEKNTFSWTHEFWSYLVQGSLAKRTKRHMKDIGKM